MCKRSNEETRSTVQRYCSSNPVSVWEGSGLWAPHCPWLAPGDFQRSQLRGAA